LVGAVITAAGKSTRMGAFKPLLKIGNFTAIEHIIFAFHKAEVENIVIVTGNNACELENSLRNLNIIFLRNDNYEFNEMFDSIKIGINFLKNKCDKILITPADVPLFTEDTVKALLESGADVGISMFDNQAGHPIIISTSTAMELLEYKGDGGLKGAISSIPKKVKYIEVSDCGILHDMDTPADYANLIELHAKQSCM